MEVDVFISHHTSSSLHIVEAIVSRLEGEGIRCWYAPRDTQGSYAGIIARAIASCKVFLLVLNKPASESPHVLNEIDLVTKRLTKGDEVSIIPFHIADDDIAVDAQYYIGRLHWIDAMTPPMYKRVEELCKHVAKSLGRTISAGGSHQVKTARAFKLISKIPQAGDVFAGRDRELTELDMLLKQKRVVYVEGIGGIGKSELVKQYMLAHREEYDDMLFLTYAGSLKQLVCASDQMEIEGFSREDGEETDAFFSRKLKTLRSVAGQRTLIVIDNFDVDSDPDTEEFIKGSHRVIFTTRNAHPGSASVKLAAIPDSDALFQIFELNYGLEVDDEDKPYLEKLFALIEYHTYTIELLAKQMNASFLTGRELLELFENGRLRTGDFEQVSGRSGMNTAFGHISSLFSVSGLTDGEKQILRELSLVGPAGIPAAKLREWGGLSSFDQVNGLIRRSWIRRESGQRLSLHPLVCEVVRSNLKPDEENCEGFLSRMTDFLFNAWFRPVKENMAVKSCALDVAEYFRPFDSDRVDIWNVIPNFLWQVGEFDASIEFETEVFHSVKRRFGENTMAAGFVAKALGGCYFNSRRLPESVPWYELGLKLMLNSGEEESEDLAMSYEKVARCCTWDFCRDMDRAEEYFRKALDIRLRLLAALERGEKREMFEKREAYGLRRAQERVAENYMEMCRMYQFAGDYRKALEYTKLQRDIYAGFESTQNVSGLAYMDFDEGVSRYHLALEMRAQGDEAGASKELDHALDLFNKALESNIRMRGAVAIDTIDNEEYLADVYAAQGRYGDASNCYMAVISMLTTTLGPDCPRIETVKKKMDFSDFM